MGSRPTRRALLRSGGVLAATAVAGCSMLGDSSDTDPDTGSDSYGVLVRNETDEVYAVTVTASDRGSGETVFEETAEVPASEEHEWEQVLTEAGQFLVEATVDAEHFYDDGSQNVRTVSVGAPNSHEAENVIVRLDPESDGVIAWVELEPNQSS